MGLEHFKAGAAQGRDSAPAVFPVEMLGRRSVVNPSLGRFLVPLDMP